MRATVQAALVAGVVLAGCGMAQPGPGIHAASLVKDSASDVTRPPMSVAAPPAPCMETKLPPVASRLASTREYPSIRTRLTVVPAAVRPRVMPTTAFDHLGYDKPAAGACNVTEVLAYWASDDPATVPPKCVPPGTSPWSAPTDCPAAPLYAHLLAWVFTWRTDCVPLGGPATAVGTSTRPIPSWSPLACTELTFVDATTGARSDYTTVASL